jgi:DNA polymerase III subunit delta
MGLEQIEKSWRANKPAAVYVFHGEEDFLRSELLHLAPDILVPEESTRSFNFDLLYGPETNTAQIVTMAQGYPMMAERRLVIVRDAEKVLRGKPAGAAPTKSKKKSNEDPLLNYLARPNPDCVLIFDMQKFGARNQSPFRELSDKAEVIEFPIFRETEVAEWLRARATKFGRKLSQDAARLMVAHLGTSLRTHANELDKLVTFTSGKNEITGKDVEQVVGASREHTVFELTKAIGANNKTGAATIALRMLEADSGQRQLLFVMLARFIEQLMIALEMAMKRATDKEIADALQLHGGAAYYVKDTIATARRYTRARLDSALRALVEAEVQTRRSNVNDALLIESLILKLLPA